MAYANERTIASLREKAAEIEKTYDVAEYDTWSRELQFYYDYCSNHIPDLTAEEAFKEIFGTTFPYFYEMPQMDPIYYRYNSQLDGTWKELGYKNEYQYLFFEHLASLQLSYTDYCEWTKSESQAAFPLKHVDDFWHIWNQKHWYWGDYRTAYPYK